MALWGTADNIYSVGTVSVDYANKTITGSGTSFGAATVGSVISIGAGATYGQAVITGITSETLISIASTDYLSGATIAGVAYSISQKPVYVLGDSNYSPLGSPSSTNRVYGVDPVEAASVVTTQYAVTHAGWVGIKTYVDASGSLRVKSETLVAFSGITTGAASYSAFGDAEDDTVYPDRVITISAQPQDRIGILTTSPTTFSVTAAATPYAPLSYQWQYSSTGVAYTNLSNGGIYSNVTTATLGIGTTTVNIPDEYLYRVVISADAATSVVSDEAILNYA